LLLLDLRAVRVTDHRIDLFQIVVGLRCQYHMHEGLTLSFNRRRGRNFSRFPPEPVARDIRVM